MGFFDIFKSKKKELSPQDMAYVQELENFHKEFKTRHQFQDGWHSIDLINHDIILSFNAKSGLADLALTISPCSPGLVTKDKPADLLIDVSLNSTKSWDVCQKVVQEHSLPLRYFQNEFEPAKIISADPNRIPRLTKHDAGQTGFWLWLPLPDKAFQDLKAFDEITDWSIRVAQKLTSL